MRGINRGFAACMLMVALVLSSFISPQAARAGSLGSPDVPNFYTFAIEVTSGQPVDGAESDNIPSGSEVSDYWRGNPAAQLYVVCPINDEDQLDPPVAMGIIFDEHGDPK